MLRARTRAHPISHFRFVFQRRAEQGHGMGNILAVRGSGSDFGRVSGIAKADKGEEWLAVEGGWRCG